MFDAPATLHDAPAFPHADATPERPRPRRSRFGADGWFGLGVMLVAAIVWCVITGRTTTAAWQRPTTYSGDALEILTHIQAAAEWDVLPTFRDHVHRLGAPFGAAWSEYPAADDVLLLGLGQLSRLVGLAPAANLALMLAQMTAAGAFFFVARWLGHRREWAAVGAILFAFSYHNVSRGLPHLSLVFTYTIPLTLFCCWLVARSRRVLSLGAMTALCLATAVCVGIGNPYNVFLFVQLMGWAVLAQALAERRKINLMVGGAAIAVAILTFFVVNADVWLAVPNEGAAPLITRNYGGVEQYALKPIELWLPPADHRFSALAFWGHRYLRWSDWRGETFSAYLGVIGGLGLVVLLGAFAVRALRRRWTRPGMELQALWIIAFSIIGGGNSALALFTGLNVFRATNRYSEFLLAMGLLVVVRLASVWSRRLRRPVSVGAAVLLLALGLADQIPVEPAHAAAAAAARFSADAQFGAALEHTLPPGAMVFQLPYVGFPESRPIGRLPDYELFRPYLHTTTLRFSYGGLKGRARTEWAREYAGLPPQELVPKLEQCGFSAIYIDRRGYEDGGRALLTEFRAIGVVPAVTSPTGNQLVLMLHPAAHPTLPLASRLTFGDGWNRATGAPLRWAYGPACLSYYNPNAEPMTADLTLAVAGEGTRHFSLVVNAHELFSGEIGARAHTVHVRGIELPPGVSRFELDTSEPAVRVSEERSRLRAFAVRDLRLDLGDKGS